MKLTAISIIMVVLVLTGIANGQDAERLYGVREMARVCKSKGRILLLEHGRSSREGLARWQDRKADKHAKRLGCNWNRDILGLVGEANLEVVSSKLYCFGVFHAIEVKPTSMSIESLRMQMSG